MYDCVLKKAREIPGAKIKEESTSQSKSALGSLNPCSNLSDLIASGLMAMCK